MYSIIVCDIVCFNHYKVCVHNLECCYLSVNVKYLRHLAIPLRTF